MPTTTAGGLGTQRWGRVLPVAFITYSLAYLDRSNYSIGIAGGMKEDLAITGGIASLIGALFFLGYFLFQIPGAIYAERRSVKNLIFWSLIAWGGLGRYIVDGFARQDMGRLIVGAVLVGLLAIAAELGLGALQRASAPRGARPDVGNPASRSTV